MQLFYYCDGASRNNGKKDPTRDILGSFGSVLTDENGEVLKLFSKTYKDVTNNQMELLGFLEPITFLKSLKFVKENFNEEINIHVVSDSQYLIKGITEWLEGWKKKGWRNSSNKTIENIDIWKLIDKTINKGDINFTFQWVKGHSSNSKFKSNEYFNNMCDKLANKSIEYYLENNKSFNILNESINSIKEVLK